MALQIPLFHRLVGIFITTAGLPDYCQNAESLGNNGMILGSIGLPIRSMSLRWLPAGLKVAMI